MSSQPSRSGRRPAASIAALRDPLVSLDLCGWLRRVHSVSRRGFLGLAVLSAVPVLLSALYWIVLDLVRPSAAETRHLLAEATAQSSVGTLDSWTVLRVEAPPVLPTMVVFAVMIVVATALCYGAGCHLSLRQANGQPVGLASALRLALPRVAPFIGWGGLCVLATTVLFGLLLLPGMVTGSPWLEMIGPALGFVQLAAVAVVVLPTIVGVVFLERAGLARCLRLVRSTYWLAVGRTAVMGVIYAAYVGASTLVVRLLLAPFGGADSPTPAGTAIGHLVDAVLTIPLVVYTVAAALVSYAELRFREDRSTTTRTLATAFIA